MYSWHFQFVLRKNIEYCVVKSFKCKEMLTLAQAQLWGGGQDHFFLMERTPVRAAVQALLLQLFSEE
jgi:hypothetical protein